MVLHARDVNDVIRTVPLSDAEARSLAELLEKAAAHASAQAIKASEATVMYAVMR